MTVSGWKSKYLQKKGQEESEKLIFTRPDLLKALQHPRQELMSVQHAILNTTQQSLKLKSFLVQTSN